MALACLAAAATPSTAKAQRVVAPRAEPPPSPADVLLLHGINPRPDAILLFFENGFSEAALLRGLPLRPREKTQVALFAIQELGNQRARQAVEVLSRMCEKRFPPGMRQCLRLDLEGTEALMANERRARLEDYVVFNSMVALGWIGDPKGAPAVRALMEKETPSGYITQGALALAMMGKVEGLARLIALMGKDDPIEAAGAARIFYYITGRYYAFGPETSAARRNTMLADVKLWHAEFGLEYETTGAEVRRRRLAEYPPNPQPPDPTSVRGLCAASAAIVDDYETSVRARRALGSLGTDALPELEAIARDPMEDNHIRREAMRYYVLVAGTDARRLLRDLRRDENPPVAERARYLLDNLEEFAQRRTLAP